jgi:D-serine deaminase-like pyridoxal phosphate-dependent protein
MDNVTSAANLAAAAIENEKSIDVFIDVNPGMNRTGIAAGKPALKLYEDTATMKGLHVRGFHVYDGHFTYPDYEQRKAACDAAFAIVKNMQQDIMLEGYHAPTLIAGGSPTFPIHAKRKRVECSPGTFVFWDRGYQLSCPEQEFDLAALVATRVISLPTPTLLCLDLGHKSVAAENELAKRVYFLNAPEAIVTGQSEEHLLIELPAGHGFAVGHVLYGVPHHICPTVALYDSALVVNDFTITAEWSIEARKRRITI